MLNSATMIPKAGKKAKSTRPERLNSNKSKVLNLCLKFLRNVANERESVQLLNCLEEGLAEGNQKLFDFLSQEVGKADLSDDWDELMSDLSTSSYHLIGSESEVVSRLFLIPVIFGIHSDSGGQTDSLQIVVFGKIRELMVRAGLI